MVIAEPPSLLTLVDCGSDGYTLCVGYRNQFDLIDTSSGKITKLHEIDAASPKVCELSMWYKTLSNRFMVINV